MIHSQRLLQESKKLLKALEKDIREQLDESPELDGQLKAEWEAARAANRTAGAYLDWREENVTQSAVHWILACVFLRFLEDNDFLARAYLTSADKEAREAARDDYERYFRANPNHSDLEYLLHAFSDVSRLPGLKGLYDERHNPLFRLPLSGDGGIALLSFWRKVDPDSGLLIRDFTDPNRETRFLGDLYQDLSESARDRYALLQTPEFVEEFILDRTLTPAIDTFGYKEVRLIDPTCGSGHFLLGAFRRLFDQSAKKEPAHNLPHLVQQALNGVYGVDINPFAVEIARFRLLVAALRASDIRKLKDAPDFRINLATGDSLLHGPRFGLRGTAGMFESKEDYASSGLAHAYQTEDLPELQRILGQQYHAVVGNPPYILPKDSALRAKYRERYITCYKKYSLGAPFTERFFELAIANTESALAGFVGMITANSFMKREFGKILIEQVLPQTDLTHVINAEGVYIPGHGTPTVIMMGRNRAPTSDHVRTVLTIRGEPTTPSDPALGRVWSSILALLDQPKSENEFVSVRDVPRGSFASHPWSLQGGSAPALLDSMEAASSSTLSAMVREVGFGAILGEDDAFIIGKSLSDSRRSSSCEVKPLVVGDNVRDWRAVPECEALFPYTSDIEVVPEAQLPVAFWGLRTLMQARKDFGGKTYKDAGRPWWSYHQIPVDRNRNPLSITFAFIATHNHFAFERGAKVFNRTAPVIKLSTSDPDEHLGLVGLLNSSVGCFWMKQVFQNRGDSTDSAGARITGDPAFDTYEFAGTALLRFPLPGAAPLQLAKTLDSLSSALAELLPTARWLPSDFRRMNLDSKRKCSESLLCQMIALQEELDWWCYSAYGLASERLPQAAEVPEVKCGERPFEIALARRMERGIEDSSWFERHGYEPLTEVPAHWPEDYRTLVQHRLDVIESDARIALVERPEYKRRWNTESWEEQEQRALRAWLLDRLETERYWQRSGALQLRSVYQLSDAVRSDADFMQVAALYTGRDDFDVSALVAELTESEAVPYVAAWRYTDDGLRKREAWEETWVLQRGEDAVVEKVAHANPRKPDESDEDYRKRLAQVQSDARLKEIGEVAVPPKYKSSDFKSTTFWRLRGALDVPKERFISYPAATPDADGTLLLGWAGWDHLQQATALAGHYLHLKENEGWAAERLVPLLAGLLELVPWLKQWHNQWNPEHDARMGDYFEGFVQDETRALETSIEALQKWRPPTAARRRRRA